ncbi:MAG: hypothetical protein VX498_12850 [Myxococcota bacterium]|nr:hypothetical protein [Myxococcota bacterium]
MRLRTTHGLFLLSAVSLVALLLFSCDLDPRPLLQNYDPDSGTLLGPDVQDLDLVDAPPSIDGGTFIGEVRPSNVGSGQTSGATATIQGTGERVCVIVDPQSVWRDDLQLVEGGAEASNPDMHDFPHDDGDLDLLAGLASFYTGTPGEEIGDFFGSFPDSNGVERAIDLNLCLMEDYHGQVGGTAGRASPEWCSFETLVGVEYRIVLQVFSAPVDDNLLKFALEIRTGACPEVDECTLRGDYDEREDLELPGGFDHVEELYCDASSD